MNRIENLKNELGTLENVEKELKRIQSVKCRLKKQKGKSTYEQEMTSCLILEQELKEVRQLIKPKTKTTTTFTQEDVDLLDYEQTCKAIRSIQSKKSLTLWLTDEPGNNDEYRSACAIEEMLIARRDLLEPTPEDFIRKLDVQTIIDSLEENQLSQESIIELLKKLL